MADNNLARNRNDDPDFLADDDPLAELARIVGYDERLVPKPPMAERREPAFNLEDELLREFERYDAPRPHQSAVHAPDVVEQPRSTVLSEDVPAEPSMTADPADAGRDDLAELEWSAVEEVFAEGFPQVETETVNVEPVFDLGVPQGAVEPVRWADQGPVDPVASRNAGSIDQMVEPEWAVVTPSVEETAASPEEPVLDLADELELTLQDAPQEPVQRAETATKGYTPGFRMPLANFNTRDAVQPAADSQEEPADAPSSYAAAERPNGAVADAVAPAAVSTPEELVAPTVGNVEQPAVAADIADDFSALDALIHDVARYPVPQAANAEDAAEVASEATSGSPPLEPVEAGVSSPKADTVARDSDPLFDDDFELALDDLELDLSDIMSDDDLGGFSEPKPAAPVAASMSAPASVEILPPAEASRVTATWSPVARFVPTPAASVAPAAPVMAAAAAAAVAAPQNAPANVAEPVDLPFDPALISESEEQPEAIVELDVPELHAQEPEETPVYRNDYDYDIDAELTALLQSTPPAAAAEPEIPEQQLVAEQVSQSAASPVYSDLDDFERAMEEDFRRSLTTPLQPLADAEEGGQRSFIRSVEGSRWSLSSLTLPLAVAGVVIVGGSIGYALLGGDSGSATGNGEPVVIAADTDPVKVLPENPGGKTVPNQDKAVYDRVAGGASDAPKQETLISTSEEPVDVVQKTLMADSLPMEGGNSAGPADTALPAQIQDDRLLPGETQVAGLPVEPEQQPIAVMPRRVKTMIVRPDGTLVEQEVPVEPAPAEAEALTGNAPAATIPAATAGIEGIAPVASDLAAAQPTVGGNAAEARNEPAADASSANAPVPTARPGTQPVNVVAAVSDQGNLRDSGEAPAAAQAPETAAPDTQVAAVAPGGYLIQIASLPSEADAQKSYQNLSAKFGSVIGGRGVDIKQAEIAGKGTFYRVRIPAGSKADAVALCEKYRAAGGSCLVAR